MTAVDERVSASAKAVPTFQGYSQRRANRNNHRNEGACHGISNKELSRLRGQEKDSVDGSTESDLECIYSTGLMSPLELRKGR